MILNFAVIVLPFLFAVVIEAVSKKVKETLYWRVGVITAGVGISALTFAQMSREGKQAVKDREDAITRTAIETTTRVSAQLDTQLDIHIPRALDEYNKSHPQQKIPVELFPEITKILKFANTTNPMLSEMARATAANLYTYSDEWSFQDHNLYMGIIDPTYASGSTGEKQIAAHKRYEEEKKHMTAQYDAGAKGLISQANEYRLEMLNRLLPSRRHMAPDIAGAALYEYLVSGRDFDAQHLHEAADYLEHLRKELP